MSVDGLPRHPDGNESAKKPQVLPAPAAENGTLLASPATGGAYIGPTQRPREAGDLLGAEPRRTFLARVHCQAVSPLTRGYDPGVAEGLKAVLLGARWILCVTEELPANKALRCH